MSRLLTIDFSDYSEEEDTIKPIVKPQPKAPAKPPIKKNIPKVKTKSPPPPKKPIKVKVPKSSVNEETNSAETSDPFTLPVQPIAKCVETSSSCSDVKKFRARVPVSLIPIVTYNIIRDTSFAISGKKITLTFYNGTSALYVSRLKAGIKQPGTIPIQAGSSFADNNSLEGVLLQGNDGQDYSLRIKRDSGDEVLNVRIFPKRKGHLPRTYAVSFFDVGQAQGFPLRIRSKEPKLMPDGTLMHDFEGRFSIESVKNVVFVESPEGPNLLYIRKVEKNQLIIETRFQIDPLWVFAIGIAAFISPIQ